MTHKKALIILSVFVLAVTLTEIINLTKVSLWHDESFSALLVNYDFPEMISRIQLDVHPPFYYIALRGWTDFFSNSLFSLRMFGVFFSFLAIFAVYFFINKAFKRPALALLASLLYALSYFQMQYAMEARMYSLGTFLVVVSGYLLLKALEAKKLTWWILYASAVSLGIYTHYFAVFWVASQAIYLLYVFCKESGFKIRTWLKNNNFKFSILAYFLVLVSYLPWLPTFFKQFGQVQETYWIPVMNIWSIPNTFSKMTLGAAMDPDKNWPVLLLLVALLAASSIFFMKKTQAKEKWLFFISLFLPFLAATLLSYKRPIYIDRYFIFGFPFYLTMAAGAILAINKKIVKTIIILAALIGISFTFPYQWSALNVGEKPGMSAAAKYVNENSKPDEKIFVGSSLIYFVFKYYNESGIPAKLYAPGPMPHFSGTALLSPEDIIADFSKKTSKGDVVWMVNTTGFGNFRPALPENWAKIDERGFQEVNAYQGWIVISKFKVE